MLLVMVMVEMFLKILFRLFTFLCATPQTNGAAATILYMIARTYYLFPCICKKKNDKRRHYKSDFETY